MKSIALMAAALTLGSGIAMAAPPSNPGPSAGAHHGSPAMHRRSGDRMTQALNLLEAKGYGTFSDFRAVGDGYYTATVTRNGQTSKVRIDPESGTVTAQS